MLLVIATCSCICMRATTFDTQRLERLAGYLNLQQLDTLPVGVTNTYSYKNHPLTIRKNQWGEIEHIGLQLFPQMYRQAHPLPIYDFLERYLLARLATPNNTEDAVKAQWDRVSFSIGTAATALKIDTTIVFNNEYVEMHVYRVSWIKDDKKILEMSFDMDYQLLLGCDAVELEHRLIRRIARFKANVSHALNQKMLPLDGVEYTFQDSYYMSPMVRNDIYYTRKSKKKPWMLVDDVARATKTINNWMISPASNNELPLEMTLDKYGYEVDSLLTTYRTWQQYCMSEGCQPYYGLKNKKDGVYEGTVFMINRTGGYLHLLSIGIPERALQSRKGTKANARMYAYIPLYNVSAQLLHNVEYEPIK